ncbi:aminotransferase class I/II-fold pyridoxal phosphate-dependent enzyme [Lactobacillus sp. DCY120]|uniref:Aminotransferase class I/II-fold pyridoxal phosphate-dependent enzyme n=1 Tax=Bombilactobacillus apium TaxID=2675299 RepID=A0A850R2T4_9LACO|nr:aminotransferase class I/II-fold pyridoxal phosphate-dependent enzyme [Bombilactobacillus apium]NVY96321.1 aminotransferase class I/II-fold pyridoxal phosphate-dependent enzyme [Bombilactobacillus apium]
MTTKLKAILAEITGEAESQIRPEDFLVQDLDFDSLMLVDLLAILEQEFQLKKQDLDLKSFKQDLTVQQLEQLIAAKRSTTSGATNYPQDVTQIANFPEVQEFTAYLESQEGHNPYFKTNAGLPLNRMTIANEEYINFSTYNYLGLNGQAEVVAAGKRAIDQYGTSVSGSRLLSGQIKLHQELEETLANFIGVDAALVQVGGHSTNVNMIGNIVGEEDLIIHDQLAHNSIVEGARLSHAMRRSFKHNDLKSLERILQRLRDNYRRVLIVVEGAYSMDGDLCPLPELIALKKRYGAILMVDEAHSFGTVGSRGAGVTDYWQVDPHDVDIIMGTLSKSCASCGGFIAGEQVFLNWLRFTSPGFIFSAGITPANTAAALSAVQTFANDSSRVQKLQDNSQYFLTKIQALGYETGNSHDTPIIPLIVGDSQTTLEFAQELLAAKINALPIVAPAVREDEARIRFFMSSLHTREDLDQTLAVLEKLRPKLTTMTAATGGEK